MSKTTTPDSPIDDAGATARLPDETSLLKKAGRHLGRLPFVRDVVASYYAVLDRDTPTSAKVILAGAIAYFVMPFDLVPDFIVGLGMADDAAVFAAAFKTLAGVVEKKHYVQADSALGRPATAVKPTPDDDTTAHA
jgi:uncharacterized membrane protein YkvA (DUF1232 family)